MARILWLNWSGGGNLPPSLGVARILTERGHQIAFAGRPEMVPRVKTAGFRATLRRSKPVLKLTMTSGVESSSGHGNVVGTANFAAAVQEWGAGVALSGDATVEAIRAAAQGVLSTPSFREAAQQRSARLAGIDGAANAANEVEALIPRTAAMRGGSVQRRQQVA